MALLAQCGQAELGMLVGRGGRLVGSPSSFGGRQAAVVSPQLPSYGPGFLPSFSSFLLRLLFSSAVAATVAHGEHTQLPYSVQPYTHTHIHTQMAAFESSAR